MSKDNSSLDKRQPNHILEEKIKKFIYNKVPENEYLDYKEKWETNNAELVKDIFSFTNTIHNKDCYLIYGVEDKNKDVVDISDDEHRKDQEEIIDLLNTLPIAGGLAPPIRLYTMKIQNKNIDILVVKNNNNVPVYFEKSHNKKSFKKITPGEIFVRIGDHDTGYGETAHFNQVKELWKKNLGIGLPTIERYKRALKDYKHWSYHEGISSSNQTFFIYDLDPRFKINLVNNNIDDRQTMPFTIDYHYSDIEWKFLDIKYNNSIIDSSVALAVDKMRSMVLSPNGDFYHDIDFGFDYFIKNSFKYYLNFMISYSYTYYIYDNEENVLSIIDYYFKIIKNNFLYFESNNEKDEFKKYLNHYDIKDIKSKVIPSKEKIYSLDGKLKLDGIDTNDDTYNSIINNLFSKFLKREYKKWKNGE